MKKQDARKLDHKTLEAIRIRAVQQVHSGESPETVCTPPARAETILPDPALSAAYAARIERYRHLYASGGLR